MALAWTWTACVLAACWLPRTRLPREDQLPGAFRFPNLDKLIHVALFAGFAAAWSFATRRARFRGGRILAAGLALAALTEVGQCLPAIGRSADLADGLADAVGLLAGLIVFRGIAALLALSSTRSRECDP